MKVSIAVAFLAIFLCICSSSQAQSLIYNGSFEKVNPHQNIPEGWGTAGNRDIHQQLTSEKDPERGLVAKLTCTQYVPGTPSSHVMLAQVDHVAVKADHMYMVSLWGRASDLESGVVHVGLANRRTWRYGSLSGTFIPADRWQRFEFTFLSKQDLKAEESRFQVYFLSTGTLWLDDITLEETTAVARQWHPVLAFDGKHNPIPNSSFECGGSGWGCWSPNHWTSTVFRLMGTWDDTQAIDGKHSWKLTLSSDNLPVIHVGGWIPVAESVTFLSLGPKGWFEVEPGKPYVLSAYVKGDRPNLNVWMTSEPAEGFRRSQTFRIDTQWQRLEFAFTPENRYIRGYVSLGFIKDEIPNGSIWIDAVQFEPGTAATPYKPTRQIEARVETGITGNIFTDTEAGLNFTLRAYNAGNSTGTIRGSLSITDFMDCTVWNDSPAIKVAPHKTEELQYKNILAGKRGFFRIHWKPTNGAEQSLRCAVIEPYTEDDSIFGYNHAFSWEFMLELSHLAGLRWWRDWSVDWQSVQPEPGPFDFSLPDEQLKRIFDANGNVLVIFSTPTSLWASSATPEQLSAIQNAKLNDLQRRLYLTVFTPKNLEDFAAFIKASVEHYKGRVTTYEILNEPLYTKYSLPSGYGYTASDYIDLLRTAYKAAKSVDPDCTIIGGIASWPSRDEVGEFIDEGGLAWCDITSYHGYPSREYPESAGKLFKMRLDQMRKRGEEKPIWVTEFGVYGDDDPAYTPFTVGDMTMTNALRPDELTASADLVEWIAVMCANGVRKVFYHSGIARAMHQSNASTMLFDYGGVPRKQYAAQVVLAHLLGQDFEFVRTWDEPDWLAAYEFRSRGRNVVILWTRKSDAPALVIPDGFRALDLMGNELAGKNVTPTGIPIYFVSD